MEPVYISLEEFEVKVREFAETNLALNAIYHNPKTAIKSWEELPMDLIKDLFKQLGCKPIILKY